MPTSPIPAPTTLTDAGRIRRQAQKPGSGQKRREGDERDSDQQQARRRLSPRSVFDSTATSVPNATALKLTAYAEASSWSEAHPELGADQPRDRQAGEGGERCKN